MKPESHIVPQRAASISRFEWIIQGLILVFAFNTTCHIARWWAQGKMAPVDFLVYYSAALGQFGWIGTSTWLYKREIAYLFIPFTWTDLLTAAFCWYGITVLCFMIMAHKMITEVKYGWIGVLAAIPAFLDLLTSGNIQVVLCLAAFYPIPALLAVLVKPHHVIFTLLLAITDRYRHKRPSGEAFRQMGKRNLPTPGMVSSNAEKG